VNGGICALAFWSYPGAEFFPSGDATESGRWLALAFTTPDGVNPYNGCISRHGDDWIFTPPSFSRSLEPGGKFQTGYYGTCPKRPWQPPLRASFDGTEVVVTVVVE
jgi:hypothetical protein